MLHVTLNGRPAEVEGPCTILEALQAQSIQIPALCHDDRLEPCGSCRMCLVALRGSPRLVTACTTPLADGMEIETHTEEIENFRRTALTLLTQHYPASALADPDGKEFHRWLRAYGLAPEAAADLASRPDDSHPYIHVDMSRCILCYRCVRICDEVQGQRVWGIQGRGIQTRIVPDSGTTLAASTCVACGACVDTCPTGALEDKSLLAFGAPTAWTRTVCPYCGTGCEMQVGTRDGRIVDIRPAVDAPVNKGHLCVKGRYAFDFVHAQDRVTEPMIREKSGAWRRVSWDEAIAFAAEGLRRAIVEHGPDSVGILGSARATNEENYLAQKFARIVAGTNNADCCARVCHAPSAAGMKAMMGTGAATSSFDDIERARTILVFGCNPLENHPIVGARIRQAARRGANLIVVDPRRTELVADAALHLQLRPGTNVPLLNAMACVILEEGLYDERLVAERVSGWKEFSEFVRAWSPERAAEICAVDAELIRRAARLYANSRPSISFHGLGLTENIQGTEGVMCLVNLALLTGNVGRPGTGVNPLRGQNNVQGAAHMGCEPAHLPGYLPLEHGRALFEQVWGAPLPTQPGLNLLQMMDAALDGRLKALWVIGYDIYMTNPDVETTARALRSLDFVIVQDMFLNETAREFASVFLPATSSFEKDGTFMNSERRIQRIRAALPPVGASKPDWEIICRMAASMGKAEFFPFRSAEEIWNEIRAVWKAGSGISYARLEQGGLQWPCASENHPGTTLLHDTVFPIGARAELQRIGYIASKERVTSTFPLLLTTGRTLYQFNAGTMTVRTPNAKLRPYDTLDMSPADAARLGLHEGETVVVRSRYGAATLPLHLDGRARPGEVFATFHTPSLLLNRVIGQGRDAHTSTPEYKVTAVRVERNPASEPG